MSAFNPAVVEFGPGTLYAAPLGSTEPTAVTGAWDTAWAKLGYTGGGSTFAQAIQTANVDVEEEIDPLAILTTGRTLTTAFDLAEHTAKNLLLAINAGVGTAGTGTGLVSGTTGTNPDGSIWVESPTPGTEVRVMLGWDNAVKGATNGTERWVGRQCLQTGTITQTRRKGANADLYTCTFSLEIPATGLKPYRQIFAASLA